MSNNLGTLTTPESYIQYYYDQFKEDLSARGLQISKVGFVGFLMNLLGFTQYDAKQYFDTLFLEAFLSTASQDENLNLHSIIFGYNNIVSNPATLDGTFTLVSDSIPPSNNVNREITISNLEFMIGNLPFTLESTYTIVGNSCQIRKSNGDIIHVPFIKPNNSLPIVELYQYVKVNMYFTLPYYINGTHYQKIIDLPDNGSVYKLYIKVKTKTSTEFVEYEVRNVKYFTSATEQVVFIRNLSNGKLLLEFGSGIYGKYIPQSDIEVSMKVTHGNFGNISKNTASPNKGEVKIFEPDSIGSGYSFITSAKTSVIATINYGEGGTDTLTGDELRNAIISFIHTRSNLISELDYYNVLKKYTKELILSFKKTQINENTIYAFILFKNKSMTPVLSKSISLQHSQFNPDYLQIIYKPVFIIDGVYYISPFIYKFDPFMRNYTGQVYLETYQTYFSKILTLSTTNTNPIPLSLNFEYKPTLNLTTISVRSYQTISNYIFHISIPILDIVNRCMDLYSDNSFEIGYTSCLNGIIDTCMDIQVDVSEVINGISVHSFSYSIQNVCLYVSISEILTLKIYEFPNENWNLCDNPTSLGSAYIHPDSYIIHIPVIRSSDYELDQTYYDSKFLSVLSKLSISENRMISDDFQVRFLNTDTIPANTLIKTIKQRYNFNLTLPLKLNVDIFVYKQVVLDDNIDTLVIIEEVKTLLSIQLYEKFTGIDVEIYKTQIIDIIHNLYWVKSCSINIFDSSLPSIEIPNANYETINHEMIINSLSKLECVTYCPIYTWWDLDNINVRLIFE